MPYRQAMLRGDYGVRYRRGDPGFLSSAFKGVTGAVTGAVRSLVTGGNPIAGAIAGASAGVRAGATPTTITPVYSSSGPGPGSSIQVPSQMRPGTAMPAVVGVSPLGTVGIDTSLGSWRGYHPNRSAYYTRSGRVEKGTKMVRNRHANYGNGRALKRALRRAHGFQHLARAVMSFTLTGKKTGRGHFKSAKRSR